MCIRAVSSTRTVLSGVKPVHHKIQGVISFILEGFMNDFISLIDSAF